MRLADAQAAESRVPTALLIRWLGLAVVLAVELLGATVWFDTASLEDRPGLVAEVIGHSPDLLNIGLAFLGVLLLIVGSRLPARIHAFAQATEEHRWTLWLGLHLAAFSGFLAWSVFVFDTGNRGVPLSLAGALGWAALALSTLLTWLMSIAPWRAWRTLAAEERWAFLAAGTAALAAWAAGQAAQLLWKPLANATFWLSKAQLELLYPDVLADADRRILGTPTYLVEIAPSCSGYAGIGLIVVFVGVYLWLFRESLRFPQALVLIPVSAAIIWLFNSVRIAALTAIGSSWSPAVADGGAHSQAGWISFIVVALMVLGITHRGRFFTRDGPQPRSEAPEHAELATALLMPFVVLMAAVILTSAATAGFDTLYPLKILATAGALWYFRKTYQRLDWGWSWHAVALGVAVFLMWIWLEPAPDSPPTLPMDIAATLPAWFAALWLVFRVAGSTVIVPLAEELAFRGYLLRKLAARHFEDADPRKFTLLAFLVSSLLFGLLHGRWLAGTLAGMAYALAVYRRGRIGDAVVAHGTTNALIAFDVLLFDEWGLWM
jgi:exosortase E/protease (VPEID-CTERM system)